MILHERQAGTGVSPWVTSHFRNLLATNKDGAVALQGGCPAPPQRAVGQAPQPRVAVPHQPLEARLAAEPKPLTQVASGRVSVSNTRKSLRVMT